MERTITAALAAPPDAVFALISDLTSFPRWLDVVHRVELVAAHPADPGPAFAVTLRAAVGPFARSKRLRMCRTERDPASHRVRFERVETDGRDHAGWLLSAEVVDPTDQASQTSTLAMRLTYDGRLWSNRLIGVLDSAAERAARKLEALAAP